MMQIDHRFEEDLTPERVNAIFERLRTEPAPSHEPPQTAAVPAATAPAAPAAPKRPAGGSRPRSKKAET
jgi:hypothetical protein